MSWLVAGLGLYNVELTFPVLLMDLTGVESSREWKIEEKFVEKVTQWKEEDQAE